MSTITKDGVSSPAPAKAAPAKPRRGLRGSPTLNFWLFTGPFLIGLAVFVYAPILWSLWLSFFEARFTVTPDKFVGFAYCDPRRPDYMDMLHHAIEDLGLKGVKFGPIYNGVHLSDPRLEPVYEYLQKNNIPLTMHMGTTYARNAPVELGRAIHVEPVALKYPDLTMILAHMGHPWYDEAIVVARKQPNVWLEQSALFYRPWQYYNMLILAEEYRTADKIFFGTDFPFAGVAESADGLININKQVEGTSLPRVSEETIQSILWSNPFKTWWKGDNPLA